MKTFIHCHPVLSMVEIKRKLSNVPDVDAKPAKNTTLAARAT